MAPSRRLSVEARGALQAAQQIARERSCPHVLPAHIALAILEAADCAALSVLHEMGIDARRLQHALLDDLPDVKAGPAPADIPLAPSAARCLQMAYVEARKARARSCDCSGKPTITTEHLLLGLISPSADAGLTALRSHGVFYGEVGETMRRMANSDA